METRADSIVKWIKAHPKFKWTSMCKEVGLDKGNFQRMLKSSKISVTDEILSKMENILCDYGYNANLQTIFTEKGKLVVNTNNGNIVSEDMIEERTLDINKSKMQFPLEPPVGLKGIDLAIWKSENKK